MPDWTYSPLLRPALRRLGPERGPRTALRALAGMSRAPGGPGLIRLLAWARPLPRARTVVLGRTLASPIGVSSGLDRSGRAAPALEALGAGFVEVGPASDVAALVLPRLRGLLLLRVASGAVRGLGSLPHAVDALVVDAAEIEDALRHGLPVLAATDTATSARQALDRGAAGVVAPSATLPLLPRGSLVMVSDEACAPSQAVALLDRGATLVGLGAEALRAQGPGLPQRCAEAVDRRAASPEPTGHPGSSIAGWTAGTLIGLVLLATGLGAAAISFGPVLLGYDRAFLGGGTEVLDVGRLLPFIRHDRITFAGVAVSIAVLYLALAWWGMRKGELWARATLAASCAVGMATLLLFVGFGYFEPLHAAVTTSLLPLLLVAVLGPLPHPVRAPVPEPPEPVRARALAGQLLLVVVALGLIGGGAVISAISVSGVFVPSDLDYLGVTPDDLHAVNDRIVPFVAHDRAGFGGALVALGLALLGLCLWGVRAGHSWVWWTLAAGAAAAFVPTTAIHLAVGYTDLAHLAPVYLAGGLTALALGLTWSYLGWGRSARPTAPGLPHYRLDARSVHLRRDEGRRGTRAGRGTWLPPETARHRPDS